MEEPSAGFTGSMNHGEHDYIVVFDRKHNPLFEARNQKFAVFLTFTTIFGGWVNSWIFAYGLQSDFHFIEECLTISSRFRVVPSGDPGNLIANEVRDNERHAFSVSASDWRR